MKAFFTKHTVLGALLFMLLVGEATVVAHNGLFTLPGFISLFLLYFFYFPLLESLVNHYNLNNLGIVLVNFALYSVFITGLLHGELSDYMFHPENTLITTLIRIQCSFYPLYAFYLLRRFTPVTRSTASLRLSLPLFIVYIILLSPSGTFGLKQLVRTFHTVPLIAVGFSVMAALSLIIAFRRRRHAVTSYHNFTFGRWAVFMLVLSFIPALPAFLVLLVSMICVSLAYLRKPAFRSTSVI